MATITKLEELEIWQSARKFAKLVKRMTALINYFNRTSVKGIKFKDRQ